MASPVIAGLRKQYPGYEDLSDDDFVQGIHDAHYKDMSEEDFLKSMDDAYTPKTPMKPQAHWGDNIIHALGDAARSLPGELWKDATGLGKGYGQGFGAGALEAQNAALPSESPTDLRARGYKPKQVQAVLRGNADIQQQETGALQDAAQQAVGATARGSAFLATLPIGGEGLAPGKALLEGSLGRRIAGSALGSFIKNPITRHAITGGTAVGAYQGIKSALEGDPAKKVAAEAAGGVAMGAIMGPIMARGLEAVGSVLSIPKNIIAGYSEASARLAAHADAAGRAAAGAFTDRWVNGFNPASIRNFPEIHNALANGQIKPDEAANLLLESLRSSRPGGFLDDNALNDPATRARLQTALGQKLGKWWLAQPSARIQLRNLPRPIQPVADIGGNEVLNTAAPEPNVIGEFRQPTAEDLSMQRVGAAPEPNAQLPEATPPATMLQTEPAAQVGPGGTAPEPGQVGLPTPDPAQTPQWNELIEGNNPPAPTPFAVQGVVPEAPAAAPFNQPVALNPPLGIPGQAIEPNLAGQVPGDLQGAGQAVQPGTPPDVATPVQNPTTGLEGNTAGTTAATEAPTLETAARTPADMGGIEPTGRDMSMTRAVGGRTPQDGSLAASLGKPELSQWREFIDGLGPEAAQDLKQGIEENISPVAEKLTVAPPEPKPGAWHQLEMFADANIVAAKKRMAKRGVRLNAFIDPADVADAAIIGANYMLKGATSFAEWSTKMIEEFGDTVKPHLQRLYGEAKAAFENRRPAGSDVARQIGAHYNTSAGLGPMPTSDTYPELTSKTIARIADAYNKLPNEYKERTPKWQEAFNSFKALSQEIALQYQHLQNAGVNVEYVTENPYASVADLMADVTNGRIRVYASDANPHSMLTMEEQNQLRAVHDYFGHGMEGYEFDPQGTDNAFRRHAQMFSDDAIPALATEVRGPAMRVNASEPGGTGKAALLPEWSYKDIIEGRKREAAKLAAGVKRSQVGDVETVDEIAKKVTKGVKPTDDPKAQVSRAVADGVSGIPAWQKRNAQSRNWYSKSVDSMMEQTVNEYPVMRDNPGKQGIFKLFLAMSSTGNKPILNYAYATNMFDAYQRAGVAPLLQRTGKEYGLFGRSAVPKFNALLETYGGDENAVMDHLLSKDEKGNYAAVKLFGPKIGRFFMNLYGIHTEVTVDRWMVRWWNRVNGVRDITDIPQGEGQRKQIVDAVDQLAKRYKLSSDEVQAILWDREKEIWRTAGMRDSGDMDFNQAAEVVLKNRNNTIPRAAEGFQPKKVDLRVPKKGVK